MATSVEQTSMLNAWGVDIGFSVDPAMRPKVEFARLAKLKGWVGGDANWCSHWYACFGEEYPYGARQTNKTTTKTTSKATADLVDRMRRLSVGSDGSSFSVISAAPSVQSLDSIESLTGGVAVLGLANSVHADPQGLRSSAAVVVPAPVSSKASKKKSKKPKIEPDTTEPTASTPTEASPFWHQFPGFMATPTATFKNEFASLTKQQGWGTKVKRARQTEALSAEVAFHYGTCMQKLHRWQELCEEVGIENIPTSITQCRKALQSVFVNLFNLIDHKRNPEVEIIHFKSYGEFSRNVRSGNQFPRACAKKDGFIKVLLRKL